MKSELAAAAVLGVAAAACGAPPPPPATPATPAAPAGPPRAPEDAALDAWAEREVAPAAPSVVLGLVDATGLRWHRGLGSRDARGGPRPDRTTVYRLGSVTKLITGTAVMQLRDAGVLDLDTPVTRWVPELAALGASQPPVTLRHLVTHTSGIPRLGDGSASYWEQRAPDRAALIRALGAPLEFAPGSRFAYSNAGMALVGEIVARAAGEPFRAYATRRVLEPLGMRTAVWDRGDVPPERLAIGVGLGGAIDSPHWQMGSFEPTGGLYASLDDMAAFARFALGGAPGVLAPASLAEMQRDDPLPGKFGLAWATLSDRELRYAWHNGSTIDYSAAIYALPDRGLVAIALVAGGAPDLADCAAMVLVRAAATGTAPEPCTLGLAAKRAAADAGLVLLRRVLDDPSPAVIAAAFEPDFLAETSVAEIAELARHLRERFGRCARHEIGEPGGLGVRALLHCERGTVRLEISAADEPPHRITAAFFPEP